MCRARDLEAVADPDHETAVGRELRDALHDRREARNRAASKIVAVAEAARQHDTIGASKARVLVPEEERILAHDLAERVERIGVIEGAGETDHPPFHCSTRRSIS